MSLAQGLLGFFGQKEANAANIKIARENRDFQERMSNTAWQRQRSDMELAGINPILAYKTGGASSPGGSMARVESALGAGVQGYQGGKTASAKARDARSKSRDASSKETATALQTKRLHQELDTMRQAADKDRTQAKLNIDNALNAQRQGLILEQSWEIGLKDVAEANQYREWLKSGGGGTAREIGNYMQTLGIKSRVPSIFKGK